jgi:hypothetical protein
VPHAHVLSHRDKLHTLNHHSPSRAGHQHVCQSPGTMTCLRSSRKYSKAVKGEERSYSVASSTSPTLWSALGRPIHDILYISYVPTNIHTITGIGANPWWTHFPIRQFCEGVIVALHGPECSENYCTRVRIMPPKAGAHGGTGSQGPSREMPGGQIWNCPIAKAVKQCSEMGCNPSVRQARSHLWANFGIVLNRN